MVIVHYNDIVYSGNIKVIADKTCSAVAHKIVTLAPDKMVLQQLISDNTAHVSASHAVFHTSVSLNFRGKVYYHPSVIGTSLANTAEKQARQLRISL